jgi:acyl-CoA hydrolase
MNDPVRVSDTYTQMTELVLPQHTNQLGNLLGGQLMHWIDICAAIAGVKVNSKVCVTASVDRIDFHEPIRLGDVVTLLASVNRVFKTSMEIGVKVFKESLSNRGKVHSNSAYLTFVCLDSRGRPFESKQVLPESNEENRRFEKAMGRRRLRLQNRSSEK